MIDDFGLVPFLACLLAVILILASAPDLPRLAVQYWHRSFFFLCCGFLIAAFLVVRVDFQDISQNTAFSVRALWESDAERDVRMRLELATCRDFVTAHLPETGSGHPVAVPHNATIPEGFFPQFFGESRAESWNESTPPQQPDSLWGACARAFGLNYWKYDITIAGENGGHALCRAYRAQGVHIGEAALWCETVFAPRAASPVHAAHAPESAFYLGALGGYLLPAD